MTSNNDRRPAGKRGRAAVERELAAAERGSAADERELAAAERGSAADERELAASERGSAADERELAATERGSAADARELVADERELVAERRDVAAAERDTVAQRRELDYARSLLASAPDAMVIVNSDGIIRLANAETERLFGYDREDLIGEHVEVLLPARYHRRHPDERASFFTAPGARAMGEDLEVWGRRKDGSEFAVEIRLSALETEEGVLAAAAIRDVTERREAEQFRQAVMDHMADGVYVLDGEGRLTYMNAAAEKMLGYSEDELRGKDMHAAIHFQHADGSVFPPEESDLLQVHTEGRPVRKAEDAFTRKDGTILPTAYSAAPLGAGTGPHGVVVVFRDTTEERAQQTRAQREFATLTWVGRVRDALDDDRLILYTQPIVPLGDGEPREELLVRMVGRDGEVIAPERFLPAAEKYGLIGELDQWVITQAVRLAADGVYVHANLSADSIGSQELLAEIEQQLRDTNADPSKLVLELTETALMGNLETGEAFARRLVDLGCALALDDFGTGFASFTYLKRLPIAYLKIDIDFVRDLPSNTANQHLVKGIVNLAKGFGHQTVGEGVEDAETLELLRAYGVDFAQGFHVGRPAPLSALPRR